MQTPEICHMRARAATRCADTLADALPPLLLLLLLLLLLHPTRCNARGDLMLSALNLTSHLEYDNVRYGLPGSNSNDRLAAAAGLVTTAATANVGSSSSNGASVNYNQS
jgi:hypothetical protein